MTNFYLYIDGTWLFKQCRAGGELSARTEHPELAFPLSFSKLISYVAKRISEALGVGVVEPKGLYIFTSIFELGGGISAPPSFLERLERSVYARTRFVEGAVHAGFSNVGVFRVPFRQWMVPKLEQRDYQEKMVDTALVAHLVKHAITSDRDEVHVVLTGDLDMLPGIQVVVPNYTDRVILASMHPEQFDPRASQTSFGLHGFAFKYGPFYLERGVGELADGEHVYLCANPRCNSVFVRADALSPKANPFCKSCLAARGHR